MNWDLWEATYLKKVLRKKRFRCRCPYVNDKYQVAWVGLFNKKPFSA